MLRRHRRSLLLAFLFLVGLGLVATFVPSNHYIVLPDRARPADPLVDVPGETHADDEEGIYMVDVRVGRASLFERLFPGIHEGATLIPEKVLNPEGVSDTQRRRSSLNAMTRSQEIAVTVALRELGREVEVTPLGAEVTLVQPGFPAEGELQIGDVIVEARGRPVRSRRELSEVMSTVRPGEKVTLAVRRGGRRIELTLPTRASESEPGRAIVGVLVEEAADFDFPIDVRIDAGSIGGPSAGLAFALEIVDELGADVDAGRRVVATGELTLAGDVLAIGGVAQKTVGARQAGADVFLVPDANAAEARRHAEGLEIVAVSTFDEALSNLATS